jgi:predicted O-methyltransferase YrrM
MLSLLNRALLKYRARNPALREQVAHYNDFFFQELGIRRENAVARYQRVGRAVGIDVSDKTASVHQLAFAALYESGFRPRAILELGTYLAETTAFLAELFPEARVYTVELPDQDPLYQKFHPPGSKRHDRAVAERLARPNIVALRLNTSRLMEPDLPDFDLIWLDAGHYFPEVAWDHFYCMHRLAPDGWLFSDDVRLPDSPLARRRPNVLDVYTVLQYYNERQTEPFKLLLKREDVQLFLTDPKYIGYFHKRAAGEAPRRPGLAAHQLQTA